MSFVEAMKVINHTELRDAELTGFASLVWSMTLESIV